MDVGCGTCWEPDEGVGGGGAAAHAFPVFADLKKAGDCGLTSLSGSKLRCRLRPWETSDW